MVHQLGILWDGTSTWCIMGWYLGLLAAGALVAQAGDGGLVSRGDAGGAAGVPQVVVVDFALGGAHHHPQAVRGEVHRRQGGLCPDHP